MWANAAEGVIGGGVAATGVSLSGSLISLGGWVATIAFSISSIRSSTISLLVNTYVTTTL